MGYQFKTITKERYDQLIAKGVSREHIIKLDESAQKPAVQKFLDAASSVANFAGAGKVAESFGTELARLPSNPITVGTRDAQERALVEQGGPSVQEVTGSALRTGALLVPGGQATIAGRIGAGAAAGYAFDVGNKLANNERNAFAPGLGTVVGAGLPILGAGARAFNKTLNRAPTALMRSAIGQPKAQILAGKDVSGYALRERMVGSADRIYKSSQTAIKSVDEQIAQHLNNAPKMARVLKNEILSDVVKKVNTAGGKTTALEVRGIIDDLAPEARGLLERKSFSVKEANDLRVKLDKIIGDKGFLVSQIPYRKEVLKSFSNALRERVKTLAPETRPLFNIFSKEVTLSKALKNQMALKPFTAAGLGIDAALGGIGYYSSGGDLATAAGLIALRRGAQSTAGKTTAAVGLDMALKQTNKLGPILSKLSAVERATILSLLGYQQTNQTER